MAIKGRNFPESKGKILLHQLHNCLIVTPVTQLLHLHNCRIVTTVTQFPQLNLVT